MKVIEQSHEILQHDEDMLKVIERAARTCYKSEDLITEESAERLVGSLIKRGHHAMLEFGSVTVKFITDRGVTHEIVRHRLCSFAQESTRYVNYNNKGFEFIKPVWWDDWSPIERTIWKEQMCWVGDRYNTLIGRGSTPQQARSILPNSLKAEIVVKANVREWRHIFTLRCNPAAHPQMVELMKPVLAEFQLKFPILFDDIEG